MSRKNFMKRLFFKLFSWLFIFFCLHCSADCFQSDSDYISCPKTYIRSDQLFFHENAIFVQIHDVILEIKSIYTDEKGIFFEKVKQEECGNSQWKCTKLINGVPCNTCNWIWEGRCKICWRWRGED
jgi:hypothetical protein